MHGQREVLTYERITGTWKAAGGEGGIRTLGTLTRTTVFEFDNGRVSWCALVSKRVDPFANSHIEISADAASCYPVIDSSLANWFANSMELDAKT